MDDRPNVKDIRIDAYDMVLLGCHIHMLKQTSRDLWRK